MWTYNYSTNDELMHHGVLGMKWGKRKARRLQRANDKKAAKQNIKNENAANKEAKALRKQTKKEYKEATSLNKHQKNVRAGVTIASAIVLPIIGGIAVGVLTTKKYRADNAKARQFDRGKAAAEKIINQ